MNIYLDRAETVDWEGLTDEEREKFEDCFSSWWNGSHHKKNINNQFEEDCIEEG